MIPFLPANGYIFLIAVFIFSHCFGYPSSAVAQPSNKLAAPEQITLKGNLRSSSFSAALGQVEMRWQRAAESLFGRTPERALAEAMNAASRALRQNGFPPELRSADLPWKVVFMSEDMPEKQIPSALVNNCHPAWMTPPANIYVVAERAAAGCGGSGSPEKGVADARLTQILIHEIGHALEYVLLGPTAMGGAGAGDRMRAEGFASWFEQFASEYTATIPHGSVSNFYRTLAWRAWGRTATPFPFRGSAEDYARASLFFSAIVERRSVSDLMRVYQEMRRNPGSFEASVQKTIGWDQGSLYQEVTRLR